jgi:hypothetical protein
MQTVKIYIWNFIGTQKEPRLYKPDMSKWSPYELDVEEGVDYILPEGFRLSETEYGEPIIVDSKGYGCKLKLLNNGVPAIVDKNLIPLKKAI